MKIFLLAFIALSLTTAVRAEDLRADALAGTTWEGSFDSAGMGGRLRLAFLKEPNGAGSLQYFSKPIFETGVPPADKLLAFVDKGCDFTPRALELKEEGGTIRVSKCATSAEEEIALSQNSSRPSKLSLKVKSITVEANTLRITVAAGPLRIKYRLLRTDASESAHSREELKNWADHLE